MPDCSFNVYQTTGMAGNTHTHMYIYIYIINIYPSRDLGKRDNQLTRDILSHIYRDLPSRKHGTLVSSGIQVGSMNKR